MFRVEFLHALRRNHWQNRDSPLQIISEKLFDYFLRNAASRERHRQPGKTWRDPAQRLADIKNPPLIEPRTCIEQPQRIALSIFPRNKKSRFHSIRNVRHAL